MALDFTPIVAIATPPGRGGVGIIRVSGQDLRPLQEALFPGQDWQPRYAYFRPFLDAMGELIDQGLVIYFKAPSSYTGEDVLELHGHGGPMVLHMLLNRCLEAGKSIGLRLAHPGEFTQRAFLNNKLDLAQAEAVADLIEASSQAAVKAASLSLSGAFSTVVHALVDQVVHLRMLVEATLDFPEEEVDFLEQSDAMGQLRRIEATFNEVLGRAAQGSVLQEGLKVVLAGRPNVGKSSLLNTLVGEDVAIVTPIAGTTRDKVVQTLYLEGLALHIIDTAGIREAGVDAPLDAVESMGIERTWGELLKADVILHMMDATRGPTKEDEAILLRLPQQIPIIHLWNKIDMSGHKPHREEREGVTHIYLSAQSGEGLPLLRESLFNIAGLEQLGQSSYLARARHVEALESAKKHLQQAIFFAQQKAHALDVLAEELRLVQEKLGSITGEFTSDDLLGVIFSRFCIGK